MTGRVPTAAQLVNGALLLAGAAYAAWAVAGGNAYAMRVLSVAGTYAILAMGYQFIFGHAGALALSQGSFMGVGAYVSGLLALRAGLPFDAALPLSVGVPVLLALLVAVPVLRLETHSFALATLILGQVAFLLATEWIGLTGGANGLGGVGPVSLLGMVVRPGWPLLAVCWGFVALAALLAWQITRGRLGLAWAMARGHSVAAGSIGLDQPRLRLLAFLLAAGYAGLAGSLHVHVLRVVSPDALAFPVMVSCLTITVVGGRTRIAGVLVAAVLVVQLPEWFRGLQDWYLLAYGAMLLGTILLAPQGLLFLAERLVLCLRPMPAPILPSPRSMPPDQPPPETQPASEPLLRLDGLSKRFGGVAALRSVSIQLRAGQVLGVIGPNGSGKTTLVNLVSGQYAPDAGRVVLNGTDLAGQAPDRIARAGIGRSFQTAALVDGMTVLDTVALARDAARIGFWRTLFSAGSDLAQARAEALALLHSLGLAAVAALPCGSLPSGLRRQVEIARALATRPRLLLLDEPAAGLDAAEGDSLAALLRTLARGGMGLLVVEHSMPFLLSCADRLVCLDAGQVIADGTPGAVRSHPRVVESLLGGTGA